jgi:hypothetical protein
LFVQKKVPLTGGTLFLSANDSRLSTPDLFRRVYSPFVGNYSCQRRAAATLQCMKIIRIQFFICCCCFLAAIPGIAQNNLPDLSDEFTDSASVRSWSFFHRSEQFPDKIKFLQVHHGLLHLQPKASGWYADYQAPFLFKTVTGDFDVRARIKVSGAGSELPTADWSLAGLMVRQPKRTTSANWQPGQENWLFITTGVADHVQLPVIETKTTNNSLSNLKLRPAQPGWVELRIVRIDAVFILLRRYDGGTWQVMDRFYRPLLRGPLQVGLAAYSGWNTIPADLQRNPKLFNETVAASNADLLLQADYIRFKRPAPDYSLVAPTYNPQYEGTVYYSVPNLLSDYSISNGLVLKMIGD